MHNPKLKIRLPRIKVPTLFIWGENDGVATTAYGKAYSEQIPGAKFVTVAKAGHYPHIEQPQAVLQHVNSFIG
jgi:pimeloyl-ACP methyl ester carboxylesterase